MISVVMPAYNCAPFIGEAVASVLGQTRGDLELIVVDDGSDDGTAEAALAVRDPRLRLVRSARGGISRALNRGMAEARGALFSRLDADDVWLPRFLERTGAVLDARPELDVAYARSQAMSVAGVPRAGERGVPMHFPDDAFASMLLRDCTASIAVLARRACFDRAGGYDPTLVRNEDWDFWLRVSRHARFHFVDEVLARFRQRPGSITRRSDQRLDGPVERLRVLERALEEPELPPGAAAVRGTARRNVYFQLGVAQWSHGRRGAAVSTFARALQVSRAPARAAARLAYLLAGRALRRYETVRRARRLASRLRWSMRS